MAGFQFGGVRINVLVFGAIMSALAIVMGALSPLPILLLRHYFLPDHTLEVSLDFIPKVVRSSSTPAESQLLAFTDLRSFSSMSKYDYSVNLILTMPRDEMNLAFGNFAVRGALSDKDWALGGRSLYENFFYNNCLHQKPSGPILIERMALMPFKSRIIELFDKLLFSLLYVTGLRREESTLVINLWDHARRPRDEHPFLLVTLPHGLRISRATLKLDLRLEGFLWSIEYFPTLSLVLGSIVVFLSEFMTVFLMLVIRYLNVESSQDVLTLDELVSNLSNPRALHLAFRLTAQGGPQESSRPSRRGAQPQITDKTSSDDSADSQELLASERSISDQAGLCQDSLTSKNSSFAEGLMTPEYP